MQLKNKQKTTCLNIMEYNLTSPRFMERLFLFLSALGQDDWNPNT